MGATVADESHDPLHQVLDLLFYAPIGLGLAVRDQLPELIRKGHAQVDQQVGLARMIGRLAVKKGGPKAMRMAGNLRRQATSQLGGVLRSVPIRGPGGRTAAPTPPTAKPRPSGARRPPTNGRIPVTHVPSAEDDRAPASETSNGHGPGPGAAARADAAARAQEPAPSAEDLAIPGYDSLAASQVVQRLEGLARDELEAVRQYEAANRARRTVLSKIAQLQSS